MAAGGSGRQVAVSTGQLTNNSSTRNNNNTFEIRFTRTTQKAGTIMCKRAKVVEYFEY